MASRVTQVATRTLVSPNDANARVTQLAQRTLILPNDANARVTQLARRVLVKNWATPGQSVDVSVVS